ncbi:V-type ATP synthase subunit B [Solibaculum mannosilyticum]|uniref:V-type ATP synthase beta chain n=1 Tax=Solibaculum mannosilyticum TaxID=2780922 RepID=A0A7I8D3B0_9FIRM|nr:V-type ATP synthase subunit B [Solibaculum mannosilyticum]MCO7137850.1 V-type ATP synthase subunit B [[Clostridium] leptum]BCI60475.1 V-type ATP synthase subunit B [Solibaculum mannosilyticum]CZT57021.1 V-type sodium ATPase subunit B [Eubacteriaceae bacterium CHKCI005]
MILEHIGLKEINGPLIVLDDVDNASFEEMVEIRLDSGEVRTGRIVQIDGRRVIIQVFENTRGISLKNTRTRLSGHPMELPLSPEILGRVFDGAGRPIDGLGEIYPEKRADINGMPMNPVCRAYPRNYINTGISSIDCLMTLIRGQKLPIFSGSGMSHDDLAVQIVRQARISDEDNADFAIVFAAMGVKNDVAQYFRRSFEDSGVLSRVVMFLNLSNDPIIERIVTPRCALTAAEYLAFEKDMNILVIMTDMTSYAEANREFSSSKGEIPGRKGYPGYLYSDLASLYERAGMIKGKKGSVTQIPILTMPNDDITHPVPDLTGYITEGQIVLDRNLDNKGIYPPVSVLPSLSRLMKDGIGEGYTREDHSALANQLFASYARVQDARSLASVIGEEELSPIDKRYIEFGKAFENLFLNQGHMDNRTIQQTLDLGWQLLTMLPKEELDRVDSKILEKYYKEKTAPEAVPTGSDAK